jgi:diguanylate cyclase (GGDEF)-like protein/PAS domain S-box-containing protein
MSADYVEPLMYSSLSVLDIADPIAPITPNSRCADLYDRFRDDADLLCVAVVDEAGNIQGLIERHAFILKMAAEFGRALYGQRPVNVLMRDDPMRVDIETPLSDFTNTVLLEQPSELMRGFIATREGRYHGVGTALSVLRATSAQLQTTRDELQRSQTFLNTVIQTIPAMVMVTNAADNKIVLLNQAGEDMLSRQANDVIGRASRDVFGEDRARVYEAANAEALASPHPIQLEEELITGADGQARFVQLKKAALRSEDGAPDRIITMGLDLTEQRLAEERIRHLAHYDSLTGLANRVAFAEEMLKAMGRINRAQLPGQTIALHCLDLDRFKAINDGFGHMIGDELLIMVAERLKDCVRKGDLIARMGGDEFAIIQNVSRPDDAQKLAMRVIRALNKPFLIRDLRLEIGTSIGIALCPADGMETEVLLARADLALYRVKSAERNAYCFFEPEMDEATQKRMELEHDLKRAFSAQEFCVYYQPIINLSDHEVCGFEALLRWNHPVRGQVSPAEFIPMAEETGLIEGLGQWVLEKACMAAQGWPENWRIAVNVSPIQFRDPYLIKKVQTALKKSGLNPQRLELEITEGVMLDHKAHNMRVLGALRDMGVRIAMDDFGTGYSSLSYLRAFSFDKIKIDQAFVRDLPGDANAVSIARAIIQLGQSLNVLITAEGIETEAQSEVLKQMGCHQAQGYLFGRPAPDVTAFLPLSLSERAIA